MKNFLRFFSLTTASQIFILITQLLILPLQLREWGHVLVGQWLVVVSIANLATIADLGLRNAGHAQLVASLKGDADAALEFRDIWALSRTLLILVTLAMLTFQVLMNVTDQGEFVPYLAIMIISLALDTTFFVRGAWQDTLGHFAAIEVLFLGVVSTRLFASILALVVFHASPETLAWIMLLTSVGLVAAQSWYLPHPRSLALTAGGFLHLRWRSLGVVRFVVSDPAANWVRTSLPVVVFGVITSPAFVTSYVALRAVFGVARQVLNQVARYASVKHVQHIEASAESADGQMAAEIIAVRAILGSTLIGIAVSAFAMIDNGRLLRLWLGEAHVEGANLIVLSFGLTALGYGYVVAAQILTRVGDVVGVARRHYIYLAVAGVFALIVYCFNLPRTFLVLLAAQELLLCALFTAGLGRRVMRASINAFVIAFLLLCVLTALVELNIGGLFVTTSVYAVIASFGLGAVIVLIMIAASLVLEHAFRRAWNVRPRVPRRMDTTSIVGK